MSASIPDLISVYTTLSSSLVQELKARKVVFALSASLQPKRKCRSAMPASCNLRLACYQVELSETSQLRMSCCFQMRKDLEVKQMPPKVFV
jgi:hypothetical protein